MEEGNRAQNEGDDLSKEEPLLIDPSSEDPERHFHYDWGSDDFVWITPRANSRRGSKTIEVLGLNREQLLDERARVLGTLLVVVEVFYAGKRLMKDEVVAEAIQQVREETAAMRPFAGLRRDFFRKCGLGDYLGRE
jgi:hypothetical protein